jgi:RNA-directed DNA polymerase
VASQDDSEGVGEAGCAQGGVISPSLSNLYLNEADKMLERAKEVTCREGVSGIEYARFADDLVVLVRSNPRHVWLQKAVEKRLQERLAKLDVEVNEEGAGRLI